MVYNINIKYARGFENNNIAIDLNINTIVIPGDKSRELHNKQFHACLECDL